MRACLSTTLGVRRVRLADLVVLKLFAGSRFDLDDVVRLLDANPSADLDEIRRAAAVAGLEPELDAVLARLA